MTESKIKGAKSYIKQKIETISLDSNGVGKTSLNKDDYVLLIAVNEADWDSYVPYFNPAYTNWYIKNFNASNTSRTVRLFYV